MSGNSLVVENLSKYFDEDCIVDSVSFSLNYQEIVGFLGPNGAGKTTTMKMITGLLRPTSGNIFLNEQKFDSANISQKEYFGYLPETNPLFYEMYVMEFFRFIANVRKLENAKKKIETYVKLLGLEPMLHKKISTLSKGFKQRVGLLTSILHEPKLLILDEPFSGLDPNQQQEMRSVVKEIGKTKSILFSSHILSEVQAIANRVIFIYKGKIVLDSPIKDLPAKTSNNQVVLKLDKDPKLSDFSSVKHYYSNITINNNKIVFYSNDSDKLKKELMKLAIDNNWNIISLQNSSENLEHIFNQLTSHS